MNSSKEIYQQFCKETPTLPYFFTYAYYKAIYKDNWEVILAKKGNDILGIMPFIFHKKKGFKVILPEPLIPYQGIWINYPPNQKYTTKIGFEKEVINTIINQLPNIALFRQQFTPNFTNWLPFYWKGYQQTIRYTYIIEDISNLEQVFSNFSSKLRGHIRKAEKNISVTISENIDLFYSMKINSAKTKNISFPIKHEFIINLYDYCKKNNCGELLQATDKNGNIHSLFLYMWDNFSAYGITSVTNDKYKNDSSMSLLYWEAIKRASTNTKAFNFNGSMIESVETFFKSFGGIQTPYFEISKTHHPILKFLRY